MKTSKNIIATALTVMALTTACATGSRNAGGGEVTGVSGSFWAEPTPYGMVLVDRGSMEVGPQKADSAWNLKADARGISVDGFWMDETEITNSKYKQFVFWVRDSIIRERLADPAYGGNEEFKIEEDRDGNPVTPHLNWSKAIPWRNPNEDEQRAIESVYRTNPITGVRELDGEQLNYRYEVYNHTEAAKRRNRLDPRRREYNTDMPTPTDVPVISKDTAYINDEGEIIRQTITRGLTGDYDFLNTYIVNVYPDTTTLTTPTTSPTCASTSHTAATTNIPSSVSAGNRPMPLPTGAQISCAARSAVTASMSSPIASRPRPSGNTQPAPVSTRTCTRGRVTSL